MTDKIEVTQAAIDRFKYEHRNACYPDATDFEAKEAVEQIVSCLRRASEQAREADQEPVAYRYVHTDYAGRKISRYGTHAERVNGRDPIEVHPLYASPPASPDTHREIPGCIEAKVMSYNFAHEDAVEMGYPSLTEALEHLYELRTAKSVDRNAVLEEAAKVVEGYDFLPGSSSIADAIRALRTPEAPAQEGE